MVPRIVKIILKKYLKKQKLGESFLALSKNLLFRVTSVKKD